MRLLPSDTPQPKRLLRNVRSIVIETVLFVLWTVLLPVLLLVALIVDAVRAVVKRTPWTGFRLVLMGWWFLAGELRGLVGLAITWLVTGGPFTRDVQRRRRMVWKLQSMWAGGHMDGVRRIFGLKIEIEGEELITPGPFVVLVRHASIIDNALPAAFISRGRDLELRYVLKHELQALPTLDWGGHWVPTCFVKRASDDAVAEVANVRTLAEGLVGELEGALIFPEGTRWTASKLARAQEKIAESDPIVGELASTLRWVLPPRLGGPIALLEEGRGADVLVVGHVGFDGFETVGDIWSGRLVGRTIRIKIWRHPAAEVPSERDELVAWLYARWQELDDWIDEQRRLDPSSTLGPKAAREAHVPAPSQVRSPTA